MTRQEIDELIAAKRLEIAALKEAAILLGHCSIAGCERKPRHLQSKFCDMHFMRIRNHGDPLKRLTAGRKLGGKNRW